MCSEYPLILQLTFIVLWKIKVKNLNIVSEQGLEQGYEYLVRYYQSMDVTILERTPVSTCDYVKNILTRER